MRWSLVLVVLALAACSDSTGPAAPNIVVRNSGPEPARVVLTTATGDTLFDLTLQHSVQECLNFAPQMGVSGSVYLPADTLAVQSFTIDPHWVAMVIVLNGSVTTTQATDGHTLC